MMSTSPTARLGAVYRCEVCGAELVVIRPGSGTLEPICCGRPMARQARRVRFFCCPVCGAELAVIRDAGGELAPRCCNQPMRQKPLAAPAA